MGNMTKSWLIIHPPNCENIEADKEWLTFRRCTEWCLKKTLFRNACAKFNVTPNIDLFGSWINYQITPYIYYRADPAAFAINAFHTLWQHHLCYAFPPLSLITRVFQKIQEEKATGFPLFPKWPTQTWWPRLMQLLLNYQYKFQGTEIFNYNDFSMAKTGSC